MLQSNRSIHTFVVYPTLHYRKICLIAIPIRICSAVHKYSYTQCTPIGTITIEECFSTITSSLLATEATLITFLWILLVVRYRAWMFVHLAQFNRDICIFHRFQHYDRRIFLYRSFFSSCHRNDVYCLFVCSLLCRYCIVYCCIAHTIVCKYLQFKESIDILYCIFNVIIEGCSLSIP